MKKIVVLLFVLAQVSLYSQVYQLPNGGFEEWENMDNNNIEPLHWNSFMTGEGAMYNLGKAKRIDVSTDIRPGSPGVRSIKIYATSVIGIIANGLVTTGRVNLGSTTASDPSNYNRTKTAEPGFNQPLNAKPDSLEFWAKFVCPSNTQQARFKATIHDNYDYRDPDAGDANAPAHVVGVAMAEFTRGSQGWVKYTVPFNYDLYPATSPQYILISITTNKVAGSGSASDNLYIDDIELIYNPILTDLKVGGTTVTGFSSNTTDYYVPTPCNQAPAVITAATSIPYIAYTIVQATPANPVATITVTAGSRTKTYRVHFPPTPPPTVTIEGSDGFCAGGSATITASGAATYLWSNGSTTASINVNSVGTYSVTGTDLNGCSSVATKTMTMFPLPTPEIQLSEAAICTGGDVTLTANGGTSYAWIENTTGLDATNLATVTASDITSDQTYKVQVTNANGCIATTTAAITVVPVQTIVTQPIGTTMCSGGLYTLSVEATNGTPALNYQWQSSNTGISGWTNVGLNSDSYIIQETQFTRHYRVLVSASGSGCGSVTSNVAQVNIVPDPSLSDPVITSSLICSGGTSSVNSSLQNGLGTPVYQWQFLNGSNWADVENDVPEGAVYENAATDNMTISGIGISGNHTYRLKVNMPGNGCDEAISNQIVLTVIDNPALTTPVYSFSTACDGSTTIISTSLNRVMDNTTYLWQYYDGSDWALVADGTPAGAVYGNSTANAMSISVSNITDTETYQYRALANIAVSGCQQVQSDAATLTVIEIPELSAPLANSSMFFTGDTIRIRSIVDNENVSGTYQWQFSENGNDWSDVVNGTPAGATYFNVSTDELLISPVGLPGGYSYRLKMNLSNASCVEIISDALLLDVNPAPHLTTPHIDYPVSCQGGSVSIESELENGIGAVSYQWEYFNGTDWTPVENNVPVGAVYEATGNILLISNISTVGVYPYRLKAVLEEINNRVVSSDAINFEIVAAPVLSDAVISEEEIQAGGISIVSSVLSGGFGTPAYQWQYSANNTDWDNVANDIPAGATYLDASTGTMTIKDILQPGTFYYRLGASMTGNGCDLIYSTGVSLTILDGPSLYNTQISDSVICKSGSSVLSSILTGSSINVLLNWQYYNGTSWENVSDGTPQNALYYHPNSTEMTVANILQPGAYQYRLRAFMENSIYEEVFSDVLTLKVVEQPVLTDPVATSAAICVGGATLLSSAINHTENEVTYQWQYQDGGNWISVTDGIPAGAIYENVNTESISVSDITVAGIYKYRLQAEMSGIECGEAISNFITISVLPTHALSAPIISNDVIPAAAGATVSSSVSNGTGVVSYQWEYSVDAGEWSAVENGIPTGASYLNATTATMTISGITEATTHYYRLKANMSGSGCDEAVSTAVSLRVAANPVMSPVAVSNPAACTAGSTVVSSNLENTTDAVIYQWQYSADNVAWVDVIQGVPFGSVYENPQTNSMTINTIATPGNYYYRLKAKLSMANSTEIITDAVTYTVVANPVAPAILPSQASGTFLCESATVSAAFMPGTGGVSSQDEYEYTVDGGITWSVYTPEEVIIAENTGNGMVQIRSRRVSVEAGCGSSDYSIASWDVMELPELLISGTNAVCPGTPAVLTVTGASSYVWSNGNTTAVNTVSPVTTTLYTVTGTDSHGCSFIKGYVVDVNEVPVLRLSNDTTIYSGESVTLSVSGASDYVWSTGSVEASIEVMPVETTTYSVTGTSDLGCSAVASVTVTVLDCMMSSIFSGTGSWSNEALWSNGIPCELTKVLINGDCTVPADYAAVCNDLTLSASSRFTVSAGAELNISGEMLLKADAAGRASYINHGDVTYAKDSKVERYIAAGQTDHFTVPVTGAVSGLYSGAELKLFEESQNSWNTIIEEDAELTTGTGYSCSASDEGVIVYCGTLHEDPEYTLNLSTDHCHLNVIGNMFTAHLRADVPQWSKTNVANGIWIWDPANENYRTWNGEHGSLQHYMISSQQAIIVKATGANAGITFHKTALTHETHSLPAADNSNMINLTVSGNNRSDNALVKFSSLATNDWDAEYDVEKLHGSAAAPQLASIWNGKMYSINYLPSISDTIFPLYFNCETSGDFTIELKGLTSLAPAQQIRFEDTKTGIITPLTSDAYSYSFSHTYSSTDNGERFRLIFGSPTGINDHNPDKVNVYEYDGKIIILNSEMKPIQGVSVYNALGQQVYADQTPTSQTRMEIDLQTAPGSYFVKLISNGKELTKKVIVK